MERDGVYGDDDALVAVPSVTADVLPRRRALGASGPSPPRHRFPADNIARFEDDGFPEQQRVVEYAADRVAPGGVVVAGESAHPRSV